MVDLQLRGVSQAEKRERGKQASVPRTLRAKKEEYTPGTFIFKLLKAKNYQTNKQTKKPPGQENRHVTNRPAHTRTSFGVTVLLLQRWRRSHSARRAFLLTSIARA